MTAITAVTTTGETTALCASVGVSRAAFYRRRAGDPGPRVRAPRPPSPRALIPAERHAVLALLHSERFLDQSPAEVHATLLEEHTYLCSTISTRSIRSPRAIRFTTSMPSITRPKIV